VNGVVSIEEGSGGKREYCVSVEVVLKWSRLLE